MFDFLKKAIGSFAKKAESEIAKEGQHEQKISEKLSGLKSEIKASEVLIKAEETERKAEEKPAGFFEKIFAKKDTATAATPLKELKKIEERVGFIESVTKAITEKKISEVYFDKLFDAFETELLQSNVAAEVTEQLRKKLKSDLVEKSVKRGEVSEIVKKDLRELVLDILEAPEQTDVLKLAGQHKPLVILFVGVNGVGKTTAIAKLASHFLKNGLTCVLSASDTFRAASIEQLGEHAKKLKIEMIKQGYGADPAAVAFDAIKHAQARGIDIILIDTAGRQHSNEDLMAELQKIKRVTKPHLTVLAIDAMTGNDAVEQATLFNEKIGVDGIFLSKVDADEKGGTVISVVHTTKKPILFIGTGQKYEDIEKFEPEKFIRNIFQ